ncbi:MAG: GtrA family protein [Nocardioidaceae bacterium]
MLDRLRALVRAELLKLIHEVMKFGVVGAVGFVVDVGTFNLLRYAGSPGLLEHKPLTAKAISVTVATIVTYLGNRHWTWANRERTGARREMALFFVLNAVGMAIALACLAISHYVLDLRSPLADNISANVVGLLLGMVFRFWSYRTFVFKKPSETVPPELETSSAGPEPL